MDRKIETVKIDHVTIEYSIIGEGEPILIFHGGHSNCHEEFGYQALIDNGYSLITPSRPGYGKTSAEIGESLATACRYYKHLLDYLHINKVHLMAISAGGPTGIAFAAHYPEYVQSLVLQSAVTKEWLTPKDMEYKAAKLLFHPKTEKYTWKMIGSINNLVPGFIFRQMFPSFSSLKFQEAKEKFDQKDMEEIRKMNNRQRSGTGFFIDLEQVNTITTEDLQAVSCPTLIMHSKHDSSVPHEHPSLAHKLIPNSELIWLDAWGHLIWLGKSASETDKVTIHFLERNSTLKQLPIES
ncbi:Pimeloyl-ACP methyl ester carboxylesterase [Gracilibacillus ureilyticus]|uniref:Pimeloyl-ACP methyl ester carboxylesterase n=1 Tax=Gracilibacillus ureilyticus TaxID=531814 RepID=A0A1H9W1H8_9BACI|nr:alpha/beta hydrolase [Gracilibacillus ureilyticus]SES27644.1 Pimeloyl-ACP methyl ester carboxylesterase [Gracilibacillus ureilyticus]